MRRTQLYLDEVLWNTLHAHARTQHTTISELVREAVRERYFGNRRERIQAMRTFVGIHKHSGSTADGVANVRRLRRGNRLNQLAAETARLGSDFLRRFCKNHSVELAGALIAACAILHGASLWTRNRRHYPMTELTFF